MGILRHSTSERSVVLGAHNVAGRAPSCTVRLADPSASNDHASVFWTGEQWQARDLGSTNGTFVGEARIQPRESVPLARGAVLRFGRAAEQWELVDDRGPSVLARSPETGEVRAAEDGLLALPGPDDVVTSIIADSAGRWFVESSDGSRRPATDAEHLTVGGQTWEIAVPPAAPVVGTYEERPSPTLATIMLRFQVSRDEEHVRLEVLHGDRVLPLGERATFYPLLLLARERRRDAEEAALPDADQGWYHVADLTRALNMEERTLNVTVFRLRQAFATAGVEGAESIIERRPREMRIGTGRFEEIGA